MTSIERLVRRATQPAALAVAAILVCQTVPPAQAAWGPGAAADLAAARRAHAASEAGARHAQPAPDLPAMSAEAIVERNVAARGGAKAWAAVESIAYSGKLDAGPVRRDGQAVTDVALGNPKGARANAEARLAAAAKASGPAQGPRMNQLVYRMWLARPRRQRLEVDFKDQTAIQVWDGSHGWKLRPFLGRNEVEAYNEQETRIAAAQAALDGDLIGYAAKGSKVENDGTEMVDGRPTYRLKLTLAGGEQRRVWIDSQSFLEAMIEGAPRRVGGKIRPVTTRCSDYRMVGGLQIAHLLDTRVEGIHTPERIYIDKVELNPRIAADAFDKPKPARAPAT